MLRSEDIQRLAAFADEIAGDYEGEIPDDDELGTYIDRLGRRSAAERAELLRRLRELLQGGVAASRPVRPNVTAGRSASPATGKAAGLKPRTVPHDFAALLTAPYRFVSLEDCVVSATVPALDQPLPGGFCGSIEVEWAAETPLLIGGKGQGQDKDVVVPLKLPSGDHIIPGATLRGMLRAGVEIITLGRLSQVNRHHRFALRDFFHPEYVGDGKRLSWEHLKTGWLTRGRDSKTGEVVHHLTECDRRAVLIRRLPKALNGGQSTDSAAFHLEWLQKSIQDRYAAAGMTKDGHIDFTRTVRVREVDAINSEADPNGDRQGVLVFAGKSPSLKNLDAKTLEEEHVGLTATGQKVPKEGRQKKREYVFFDKPDAQTIPLTADEHARFEFIHSSPASGRTGRVREPEGSFAALTPTLEAGGRIPVFYLGTPGEADFQMGLTRALKLGHRYSVGDKLDARHPSHRLRPDSAPDWADALFGWVHEAEDLGLDRADARGLELDDPGRMARRGRVAVGMAAATHRGQLWPAEGQHPIRTTMMGPRASFAPFYLTGQPHKDWSNDEAKLAGRKRFFPRFTPGTPDPQQVVQRQLSPSAGPGNESRLRFLVPQSGAELRFRGRLLVHNISAAELGALLWVLTHGGAPAKPYRHMLGRGRPFGAGQMRVRSVCLRVRANDDPAPEPAAVQPWEEMREAAPHETGWVPKGGQSLAPFLDAFHSTMSAKTSGRWPDLPSVREWLALSDPRSVMAAGKTDYLGMERQPDHRLALRKDAPGRHGSLKKAAQLSNREVPPSGEQAVPRWLNVQPLVRDALMFPYRKKG